MAAEEYSSSPRTRLTGPVSYARQETLSMFYQQPDQQSGQTLRAQQSQQPALRLRL